METREIFYVTNRKHRGSDRYRPTGYGKEPSSDGIESVRFGTLTVDVDPAKIKESLLAPTDAGVGDGNALSIYLEGRVGRAQIEAYRENITLSDKPDAIQQDTKLGSTEMFMELREVMVEGRDLLIFIHGYSVSWRAAVASALALQEMVNRPSTRRAGKGDVMVVLFTWPSDGSKFPFTAYKSDRTDAAASGYALGRGLLKLHDYLTTLSKEQFCWSNVNVLCHSMGNFVLENALRRVEEHAAGGNLPRIFDQALLCAADVDESVLERGQPMAKLVQLSRSTSIYHNRGDIALSISDYTKGNADRLGANGVANPNSLHRSVHQIDCSKIVSGLVEHSYYLDGGINHDIRMSLDGVEQADRRRPRVQGESRNCWVAQ
jgi:esterase/lipase superfamily enzyme